MSDADGAPDYAAPERHEFQNGAGGTCTQCGGFYSDGWHHDDFDPMTAKF